MNHDELVKQLEIGLSPEFYFTDDQADVMHAYHEGTGRVCVGSGAGTGKTTTLTRVVSEAVVRMCQPNIGSLDRNPFDEILVTTFTRDAAGQLKTKIKQILRNHEIYSDDEFDPALWRWIETDSNISTIDSFIGDLLREIAPEVRVAPGFEVRDELETEDLLRDVVRSLEEDDEYAEALALLSDELADTTPRNYLYDIDQKLREFCYEFPDPDAELGTTMFADQMIEQIHQGRNPPFEQEDIREIVSSLTGFAQRDVTVPDEDTRRRIEDDYHHSVAFAEAVDDLIDAFDAEYDAQTRASGKLSYQDITYIVWEYLDGEEGDELRTSLSQRFSHVFIDEFQDTSYAQCQILRHLVNNEDEWTDLLLIGDVKQSIYGWRSADPEIFARILEHADQDGDTPDEYLGATDWTRTELVTNFRSHPQLVRAGNHLFNQVFTNEGMGAIGTFPIEFGPLIPNRPNTNKDSAHLHILPLGDVNADTWRSRDPEQTAAAIHGMVANEEVTVGDCENERSVRAGDVTILFRRGTYMGDFREALDDHGLQNAVVADRGLFKSEEIGFIVDILDWFANPHSKDSLLRILRSPVTALDDRTLRFLTSNDLNLPRALDEWPANDLPTSDRHRLEGLVDLRSDLRWDREGSKAQLVQKIIQHTGIETILLAGDDAIQRYGNLWMLVELARDWEEEGLLAYREFVDRLKRYQQMAQSGSETFEVAQVADSSADDTVKLRTVHSSKGLEFNVVVLADLLAGPGGTVQGRKTVTYRDHDTGERRYALRPQPAGDPIDYDTGPGTKWIRDDYRSTLWLAPERDDRGQFRYPHPYNPAIMDDFAEFWRLLYVAFTRAGDHILLPLGDDIHSSHKWSSWAHALLEAFQEDSEWTVSNDRTLKQLQLDSGAMHPKDEPETTLPLDVGVLDLGEPESASPIGLPTSGTTPSTSADGWDGVPFAPRELNPSSLHDLIACPRRYQYRALQEVSEARGDSPPGSNAPDGYSPSYWGTIVHQALEALHRDLRTESLDEDESELDDYLTTHRDISTPLSTVIQEYRDSDLWTSVRNASTVLPEYELSAIHPTEPQIHLSGIVDLLFETEQGWEIIDFKTGYQPDDRSYLANQYRWQLATYAWLLREEYGIEVNQTLVFYVQNGDVHEPVVDWKDFSVRLENIPERLIIESEQGLPVEPDPDPETTSQDELEPESQCGSCPYHTICPAWQG